MITLSTRLALIASLVEEGQTVCDVGTDHGYLPAFLAKSGKFPSVTATDIKIKPLESARSNLKRLGVANVELVLCDGLSGVTRQKADTVIIAGMGGEVISGILSRCDFIRDNVTLILQPMTAAADLRDYLAQNGFGVEREIPIKDNGKLYSVMVARFCGVFRTLDNVERLIGGITPDTQEGRAYIQKQYKICADCALALESVPEKADEHSKYFDTAQRLKNLALIGDIYGT